MEALTGRHLRTGPTRGLEALVVAAGVLGFVGLLRAVAVGSFASWAAGGIALVVTVGILARPTPLWRLGVVLAAQAFQLGGGEGMSPGEILAAVLMVGYLGFWYVTAWGSGRRVVMSTFDVAALTWGTLGLVVATALGQIHGASPYDFRADLIATLPFALYLPVKDACMRERHGALVVGGVLVGLGIVATFTNLLSLRSVIADATAAWQIADARFGVGETSITAALMMSLGGLAMVPGRHTRLILLGLAAILLGGLILTKSRGFWVSAMVGLVVLGVMLRARDRRRLGLALVLGVGTLVVVSIAFFYDEVSLLALGTLKRLLTLSTAASNDISLLNRFVESRAVWEQIRENPVLGYGWGVQVTHFSILYQVTTTWAFFHNGYLALWHKTGLWGLGMVLWVWTGALGRSARAARAEDLPPPVRGLAAGAFGTLVAFSIVAGSSNPFSVPDQMFVVTLVLALAHGAADRARLAPRCGLATPEARAVTPEARAVTPGARSASEESR